jgi:hypothetical protein
MMTIFLKTFSTVKVNTWKTVKSMGKDGSDNDSDFKDRNTQVTVRLLHCRTVQTYHTSTDDLPLKYPYFSSVIRAACDQYKKFSGFQNGRLRMHVQCVDSPASFP